MIDCGAEVEIPIDSVSCQGVMTDLSFLVTNDDGSFTISQSPSAGSPIDGGFNWQMDVTITATDGLGNSESCTITTDLVPPSPPIPQDYWIAYCYNGKIILDQDVYRGYYPETNLDISSWQLWDIGVSPSWYSGYNGCPVNLNQHSVAYRRQGFPCGNYQFDILNHDNEVRLFVDGAEVFAHDGYNLEHLNVYTGFLDQNTNVEFQWNEGIGGSIGIMDLTLKCPEDTLLYLDENCAALIPDYRWDACPGGEVTQSITPGTPLTVGEHELIMTTSDPLGWIETCTTTVLVADTTGPAFACLGTLQRSLDANCEYVVEDFASTLGITDNCDTNPTVVQDISPGTIVTSDIVVTIVASDSSGNSTTCTFTVELVDDEAPSIICPNDLVESYDGSCEFVVPDYASLVTAEDNCSANVVFIQSPSAGTLLSGISEQMITISATDEEGNEGTCEFLLTLSDTQLPNISCPSDDVIYLDSSCEAVLPDYLAGATVTDNCFSTLITTQSPAAGTIISAPGSTLVTLTATDVGGNTTTCTVEVMVEDITSPVVDCPGDQTVMADASCTFVLPDYASLISITDNCGDSFNTMQIPMAGSFVTGNQMVTLTVVDSWGNFTECSFEVTVSDTSAPTLLCPGDVTINLGDDCTFIYPDLVSSALALDNCEIPAIEQSVPAGTAGSGAGVWPVELTTTDGAGNTASCTVNVITVDLLDPSFNCPEDLTIELDSNCLWVVPDFSSETNPMDNCDPSPVYSQMPAAGEIISGPGVQIVELSYTDASGNESTCDFQVLLVDVTPPAASIAPSFTRAIDEDCNYLLEDFESQILVTDNCGFSSLIAQDPPVGSLLTGVDSNYTIEFTVSDESGNTTTLTTTITLEDQSTPIVECPEAIDAFVNDNCYYILEDLGDNLIIDDGCSDGLIINQLPAAGEIFTGLTSTSVSFEIIDGSDNVSTCTTILNVSDTIAPVIFCLDDMTVGADENCSFEIPDLTSNAIAADNCDDNLLFSQSPQEGTIVNDGENEITIYAEDTSGNVGSCTFNLFLTDSIGPEITCPDSLYFEVDLLCGAVVPDLSDQIDVTNNCNEGYSIDQSPPAGVEFSGAGTSGNITFTVFDEFGNSSVCFTVMTLVDNVPPTMSCDDEQQFILPEGSCAMHVFYSLPAVEDNCGEYTLVHTAGPEVGAELSLGSYTIAYEATDDSGNIATCEFVIEVLDHEAPQISCPENILLPLAGNECLGDIDFSEATATDNCDATTIQQVSGPVPGASVPAGVYEIVYEATDPSGNEATCTFEVEIQDLTPPEIDCPGTMTFPNDEGECGAIIDFAPEITDNCTIAEIIYLDGPEPGEYFPPGQTIVSVEAIDGSGNSTGCSYIIEIIDEQEPEIECQWNIYTNDPQVIYNPPTVIDNCGNYTLELIQGFGSGEVFPYGNTTVEWMAIDPSSNFATCSFEVYVNQGPTAIPDVMETHLKQINFFPLDNDIDPENDQLYIESIEMLPNLRMELDGSLTYFPDHSTCEGDSIAYTIRDVHGVTSSSYIKIDVTCPDLVDIPDGFSPNNDGINDFLIIEGIEDFPGCELTVFSEWGNIVYQMTNYQNDWNGTANLGILKTEKVLPEAKYYYVLEMPYNSIIKKGTIYLKH